MGSETVSRFAEGAAVIGGVIPGFGQAIQLAAGIFGGLFGADSAGEPLYVRPLAKLSGIPLPPDLRTWPAALSPAPPGQVSPLLGSIGPGAAAPAGARYSMTATGAALGNVRKAVSSVDQVTEELAVIGAGYRLGDLGHDPAWAWFWWKPWLSLMDFDGLPPHVLGTLGLGGVPGALKQQLEAGLLEEYALETFPAPQQAPPAKVGAPKILGGSSSFAELGLRGASLRLFQAWAKKGGKLGAGGRWWEVRTLAGGTMAEGLAQALEVRPVVLQALEESRLALAAEREAALQLEAMLATVKAAVGQLVSQGQPVTAATIAALIAQLQAGQPGAAGGLSVAASVAGPGSEQLKQLATGGAHSAGAGASAALLLAAGLLLALVVLRG